MVTRPDVIDTFNPGIDLSSILAHNSEHDPDSRGHNEREIMSTQAFKYGDIVSVAAYPGIAFYVGGPTVDTFYDENIDDTYDEPRNGFYDCVMVGDDRVHIVDVDDMRHLTDGEYCSVCGQIGCAHDYAVMVRVAG